MNIVRRLAPPAACIVVMGAVAAPAAFAQEVRQDIRAVQDAVRNNDLRGALRAAEQAAEKTPNDPVLQQVLGILRVANGSVPSGAQAFANAVRLNQRLAPTPTGLEGLDRPGSAFREALLRQKVTFALEAGTAAARNNLGAAKIVMEKRADAGLEDLDVASGLRPDWGIPWANAAIGWMEKNKARQAEDKANQALQLGERTAKVYTTLAESAYRLENYDQAEEFLKRSMEIEQDYPYALYIHSQILRKKGRARDAERALLQALALNPAVAAESRFVNNRSSFTSAGGNQDEDHQRFLTAGLPGALAYRGLLERNRWAVEDRPDAYQRRDFAELTAGRPFMGGQGALYGGFLNEGGRRPGQSGGGLAPNATFGFNRTNIALLHTSDTARFGRLMWHAGYRHNGVAVTSGPGFGAFQPLKDDQLAFEGRADKHLNARDRLTAGFSFLRADRSFTVPAANDPLFNFACIGPVEPNEQALPFTTQSMLTTYLFGRRQLSDRFSVALGPVVGARNGAVYALPFADATFRVSERRTLKFNVLPRMMNANGDLFPAYALGRPAQENPLDDRQFLTHEYNRDPIIPGANGRTLSYEATAAQTGRGGQLASLTAFHRRFNDVYNLAERSDLSACLFLNPIKRAETTGVEFSLHQPLFAGLTARVFTRYQQSHASGLGPAPIPGQSIAGSLGYFPNFQGGIRFDVSNLGGVRVAVETVHVGERLMRFGHDGAPYAQIETVEPTTSVNVRISAPFSGTGQLFLNFYNLGGGSFYKDFPNKPSALGGFSLNF